MGLHDPTIEQLYEHAYRPLVGFLCAIGSATADAEELAQDAFVRLVEKWDLISAYDDPEAWLRRVAARQAISRHRRTAVAARWLQRHRHDDSLAPDPQLEVGYLDLATALGQLSPQHRAVVLLHYVYDRPVAEIARDLELPVGTVKSRLARAREALAPAIDRPGPTGRDDVECRSNIGRRP